MGFYTKVTDWQVCGLSAVAAADVIGVGLYKFIFYSERAGVSESFLLKGAGIGLGGNASGLVLPEDMGNLGSPWSSLECKQPFSADNLRGAWGRLTTIGGGIGVQYALVYLTAAQHFWTTESYFSSQSVGGFTLGSAGAGGLTITGTWRHQGNSMYTPRNFPATNDWAA